jgi:hypothetical protein
MSIRELPYFIELNVSGEICGLGQEEAILKLSDWHKQQEISAKKRVRMNLN